MNSVYFNCVPQTDYLFECDEMHRYNNNFEETANGWTRSIPATPMRSSYKVLIRMLACIVQSCRVRICSGHVLNHVLKYVLVFFFEIIAFDHLRLLSKSRKKSEKENTVFIFICLRIKSARVFVLMVFYSHNYFVNYGHIRYNLISID